MASNSNYYAASLRNDQRQRDKTIEEGIPFFVPQLAKVKNSAMCQNQNQQHLLFAHETSPSKTPFASATMTSSKSYRKQGNQDMYSEENLAKRKKLQEDKQIHAAIHRFWETFYCVRKGCSFIEKRDYVDVFIKFYKALVAPNEFSIAEARKIVERDWERDAGEGEDQTMSKAVFFRALFEVADIWTVGISVDLYVAFLSKLFDRVTMTVFDQEKSLWLVVFAELDNIRSLSEPKDKDKDRDKEKDRDGSGPQERGGRGPTTYKKMQSDSALLSGDKDSSAASRRAPALANEVLKVMQISKRRPPLATSPVRTVETSRSDAGDAGEKSPMGENKAIGRFQRASTFKFDTLATETTEEQAGDISGDSGRMGGDGQYAVRLNMPSIYLNPDLLSPQATENAARRKLRESVRLAQRLRRITY